MTPEDKNKMRGTRFIIHLDHRVEVSTVASKLPSTNGSVRFSTEHEFNKLAARWPGPRLVQIWNLLPNAKKVTKFTDRKTAMRRIWTAVQELKPAVGVPMAADPDKSTKAERIVTLLKAPSGASLSALVELTGWQSHSVRGFISAQLGKRMGFKVHSSKRNGERVYRISP